MILKIICYFKSDGYSILKCGPSYVIEDILLIIACDIQRHINPTTSSGWRTYFETIELYFIIQ